MNFYKEAKQYREMGWNVIPLRGQSKSPASCNDSMPFYWKREETDEWQESDPLNKEGWKKVQGWQPLQERLPTDREFEKMFNRDDLTGLGLITGKLSNIYVLDEDSYKEGGKTISTPSPMLAQSASGGKHHYRKYNPDIAQLGAKKGVYVEGKGQGGFVVLPPSQAIGHDKITVGTYKWLKQCPVKDIPMLTEIDILGLGREEKEYGEKFDRNTAVGVDEGERHNLHLKLADSIWNDIVMGKITKETGWLQFVGANNAGPGLPETEKEIEKIWTDAEKHIKNNPPSLGIFDKEGNPKFDHLTELGNAELFVKNYGDKVKYNHKTGGWLIFSGQYWKPDKTGEVKRLMFESIRELYKNTVNIADANERLRVAKFAISSEARQKIEAALSLAQNILPVADDGEKWNSQKGVLMLKNGLLSLETGELRDGKPEDRISKIANTSFDKNADCPRWKKFVQEVFQEDKELINFFHKAVGYSTSGETNEQCLFLCYGSGQNGKSVALTTIRDLLGDYAANAPSSLLQKTYSENTNDLASVDGQRLIVGSEAQVTAKLNEERLKALTGQDPITARFLHKEFFTFVPIAKFWLFVNHRPKVEDDSFALWRRIRSIPFNRTFKPEERDLNLSEKLAQEFPGILNWVVEGYKNWRNEGLKPPTIVQEATNDYRADNDTLYDFLASEFSIAQDVKAVEAYKKYTAWAGNAGLQKNDILNQTTFGRNMSDRFQKVRRKDGNYYIGVGFVVPECIVNPTFFSPSREEHLIDITGKTTPNPTSGTKTIHQQELSPIDYTEDSDTDVPF